MSDQPEKSGELCIIGREKSESNLKLLEEAKKVFGTVFLVPIDSIGIGLTDKFTISYKNSNLFKFKVFLPRIPKGSYAYAYQILSLFPKEVFMPIPPISFLLAEERFFLLTVLRKRDVPTLNLHLARSSPAAVRILEQSKFPVILRVPGEKTGVVVSSVDEGKSVVEAIESLKQPILIEDVVKDIVSVYVTDPEVVAAVKKKTKEKDVIFGAGKIEKCKIKVEVERLALDAIKAIDAQTGRVDISLNGEPKVVNIELNPNLIKASEVSGVNIPEKIINLVHQNYTKHKEKPVLMKFFEDAGSVVKDVLKSKQLL